MQINDNIMQTLSDNSSSPKDNWPIRPTFISLSKDKEENGTEMSLNKDGVFYPDMLRGFLAEASNDGKIKSPLALYQVVPEVLDFHGDTIKEIKVYDDYFKKSLEEKKIILIHTDNFFENKKCCQCFREMDEGEKCFKLDSRIMLLYDLRLSKFHFKEEYQNYLDTFREIVDDYNLKKNLNLPLTVADIDGRSRFYIHYICPYSQFEEFFFPIVAAGQVVAVLMLGQRIPLNTKQEHIFKDYRHYTGMALAIKNIPDEEFGKLSMSDDSFNAIIQRIEILESRIEERIKAAGRAYVSKTFFKIETVFRKEINLIDYKKQDSLKRFKEALDNALNEICSSFGHSEGGFIRIFGTKSIINTEQKIEFQLIGNSSTGINSNISYSFSIPQTNITDKMERSELLKYASSTIKAETKKDDDIDTTPFSPQMTYIIWKRYTSWDNKYKTKNEEFYSEMLISFYHTLLEPYAIFKGALVSETLEKSIRISGHESAQMLSTILDVIKHEFTEKDTLQLVRSLRDPKKLELLHRKMQDVIDMLKLLEGVYQRPAAIFKGEPPIKEWTDFSGLLISMKTFFDEKAKNDNLQQRKRDWDKDLDTYELKTNTIYLSHIIYNLTENAIKYGYRGSNIYTHASFNQQKKELSISIISFGIEIPESDKEKIFELFYRTSSPEVQGEEGMGIGMFLADKLCKLLGYRITCTSIKIDNVHIPAHYFFHKQNNNLDLLNLLKEETKSLLKKNISEEITNEIVNLNLKESWNNVGHYEWDALIHKITNKNVFTIIIPTDNNFRIRKKDEK